MEQQNDVQPDVTATEIQAIVDLVDANISPIANAEAWEAELVARQHDESEAPPQSSDQELDKVIELSTTRA